MYVLLICLTAMSIIVTVGNIFSVICLYKSQKELEESVKRYWDMEGVIVSCELFKCIF